MSWIHNITKRRIWLSSCWKGEWKSAIIDWTAAACSLHMVFSQVTLNLITNFPLFCAFMSWSHVDTDDYKSNVYTFWITDELGWPKLNNRTTVPEAVRDVISVCVLAPTDNTIDAGSRRNTEFMSKLGNTRTRIFEIPG